MMEHVGRALPLHPPKGVDPVTAIRAAIGVLSSMLICMSPACALSGDSTGRSARLVWTLITSGDTTFTTTIVTNEFAGGSGVSEHDFPLRGLPILHMKLIYPTHSTPHRSGMADIRAEYTICWLGLDKDGQVDCRMIDRTGRSVGMPIDGRRVHLFTDQALVDESCAPGFAQQAVPRGAGYSVTCSGSIGWLDAETATQRAGSLYDLSTGLLIAQFDSLRGCQPYARASDRLLFKDLSQDQPDGMPIRYRYFPVVEAELGRRTLGPCRDSTTWLSEDGDPAQVTLNASADGVLRVTYWGEDSLAVVQVPFDGGAPSDLAVVPYGQYAKLSHNGRAFVLMTAEFISFYSIDASGLVPIWKRPHPEGWCSRLEISENGRFVAAQLQRELDNVAPRDLYVWDREGHVILEVVAIDETRSRLQGLEFIGSTWLMEGAQFADDPRLFNNLLTTRLVNLYQLPE